MTLRLAVLALAVFVPNTQAADDDYAFTVKKARNAVMNHCRVFCARASWTPPKPCCDVFEKAMAGDFAALTTVFTDWEYHSGDNESWSFTAWPLLHVVGDKRFAAYLDSVDEKAQREIFEQVFYAGSYYPRAIKAGYFRRKFPRTEAIHRTLQREKNI